MCLALPDCCKILFDSARCQLIDRFNQQTGEHRKDEYCRHNQRCIPEAVTDLRNGMNQLLVEQRIEHIGDQIGGKGRIAELRKYFHRPLVFDSDIKQQKENGHAQQNDRPCAVIVIVSREKHTVLFGVFHALIERHR